MPNYRKTRLIITMLVIIAGLLAITYYLTNNPRTELPVASTQSEVGQNPEGNNIQQTGNESKAENPVTSTAKPTESIAKPEEQGPSSPSSTQNANQKEAQALYDQGLKLYYQRNYNSAIDLFNKALRLDPNCYQALNGKGASYAFQGKYSEGIKLIKQAITLKPDFEYAHFNLGLANELAGNWSTAISAYQSALKLNEKDVWAYYGIASIYGRQGNVDLVVSYLQQAIAIDPVVIDCAKDEKDFNPVRNDPKFKAIIH